MLNNKVFLKQCAHTPELVSCLVALGTLQFGACAKAQWPLDPGNHAVALAPVSMGACASKSTGK